MWPFLAVTSSSSIATSFARICPWKEAMTSFILSFRNTSGPLVGLHGGDLTGELQLHLTFQWVEDLLLEGLGCWQGKRNLLNEFLTNASKDVLAEMDLAGATLGKSYNNFSSTIYLLWHFGQIILPLCGDPFTFIQIHLLTLWYISKQNKTCSCLCCRKGSRKWTNQWEILTSTLPPNLFHLQY